MFDGVHCGHKAMLSDMCLVASHLGLVPIVVTFRQHPLEIIAPEKAPRLLMPGDLRASSLRSCGISEVIMLDFNEHLRALTAKEFMSLLRDQFDVSTIYMGFNHHFGSDRLSDIDHYRQEAKTLGVEVVLGKESTIDNNKISSSIIRSLLLDGKVEYATKALGQPYSIAGIVVPGKQLGRTIGYPTANLQPYEPNQLIPAPGVYACYATTIEGQRHLAMVNIGHRPTIGDFSNETIEAHILDFDNNIYNHTLTLEFISRIRSEERFPNIDALRERLSYDESYTRNLLS